VGTMTRSGREEFCSHGQIREGGEGEFIGRKGNGWVGRGGD